MYLTLLFLSVNDSYNRLLDGALGDGVGHGEGRVGAARRRQLLRQLLPADTRPDVGQPKQGVQKVI
jgi:hypothetical protein